MQGTPQRRDKYIGQCQALKIKHKSMILSNKTRWNSTFRMIERALEMKTVRTVFFQVYTVFTMISTFCLLRLKAYMQTLRLDKNLQKFQITENGWKKLEAILVLLKVTLNMANQKY